MNNNEPDTLPDPAIGYLPDDILALKQAFSLPDIDLRQISQREQSARGIKTLAVAGRVRAERGDW